MPGEVRFRLDGIEQMQRMLKELGPEVAVRIGDQAVRAGAKVVATNAKARVRVRTGQLRDAITDAKPRRQSGEPDTRRWLVGFLKPQSRRAHLTEFGTRHSRASPFLRPAMDESGPEVLRKMTVVMARGIATAARRLTRKHGVLKA